MRVSQSNNTPVQNAEISGANKNAKAAAAASTKKPEKAQAADAAAARGTDGAQANISTKAKDMAKAKEVASNTPDVREEKIAELRKRIAEGKYKVDATAVADRMVDDHLRSGIG